MLWFLCCVVSCRVVSCRVVSCRVVSCRVVWCGVVCVVSCVCGVVWCVVCRCCVLCVVCCVLLWCGVVWCGVVWCGVVWCGVVWCGVVWCGVVLWCGVVWCGCGCGCGCVRLNFDHLDIQSRRGDVFWLPLREMVTPVVGPRMFEILTTLTFGALHRNHMVTKRFGTIANKKQTQRQGRLVAHVRSATSMVVPKKNR